MEKYVSECDVFSSGFMLGSKANMDGTGNYMGGGLRTPGGLSFALTHLCVYPRKKLVDLIEETGIGFEDYSPQVSLPAIARQADFPEDLSQVHKIDTGILMNMLAGIPGWRFLCRDISELVQIGNIAAATQRHQKWTKGLRSFLSGNSAKKVYTLHDRDM